jgi:hypothetical protein
MGKHQAAAQSFITRGYNHPGFIPLHDSCREESIAGLARVPFHASAR